MRLAMLGCSGAAYQFGENYYSSCIIKTFSYTKSKAEKEKELKIWYRIKTSVKIWGIVF